MKKIIALVIVLGALAAAAAPAWAQQTTGTITGRIVDAQGAVVPGVTVTGKNAATGFTRSEVSDGSGVYRLTALPVGTYDLTAELQGFTKVENKGIVVSVGQTLDVAMILKLATVSETVTVTGGTPLIETTLLVGRRRRRHRAHREPAAQRAPVREPGRHDPRRRPRLPLRPDQEHAVLAADWRRQRPQPELPD